MVEPIAWCQDKMKQFQKSSEINLFSLQKGPVTNDMVTIYRNYVVLYSLSDVIKEVAICVLYL